VSPGRRIQIDPPRLKQGEGEGCLARDEGDHGGPPLPAAMMLAGVSEMGPTRHC
jgi:hypothetical protein